MNRPEEKFITIPHDPKKFSVRSLVPVSLWTIFLVMLANQDLKPALAFLAAALITHALYALFPPKPEKRLDMEAWRADWKSLRERHLVQLNHKRYEETQREDPDGLRYASPLSAIPSAAATRPPKQSHDTPRSN